MTHQAVNPSGELLSRSRWLLCTLAFLGIAILTFTWIRSVGEQPPLEAGSVPTPSSRTPATRSLETQASVSRAVVPVPARKHLIRLRPVAAEDDAPIRDARAHPAAPEQVTTILYDDATSLGGCDPEGIIQFEAVSGSRFTVRSPDRLPAVLEVAEPDSVPAPITVRLQKARTITVVVLDENAVPIQGARIEIYPHTLGNLLPETPPGDGNPVSKLPKWTRFSDHRGAAAFDGLPHSRISIRAWHDTMVPATTDDEYRYLDATSDETVTIHMKPLYGAVFECPEDSEPSSVYWKIGGERDEGSGTFLQAIAKGRVALQSRFPGSHVYAHRPKIPGSTVLVACFVVMESGSVWKGEWPLHPVKDIHEPVYMEAMPELSARRVSISVALPSGERIPARVGLTHKTLGFLVAPELEGKDLGDHYVLPLGEYSFSISNWSRQMRGALRQTSITISREHPSDGQVVLDLDAAWIPVTLEGQVVGTPGLGRMSVYVDTPGSGSFMVSFDASRETTQIWVEPGMLKLKAIGAGYNEAVVEQDVQGPCTVSIPLVERDSHIR